MELNNIPKTGDYGTGVDLHNDNYQKIGLKLTALENRASNEKGYFESLSALQLKYPTPQSGWQAYVADAGSSTGYYVADVNNSGAWVVTSAEAPSVGVDLNEYAKNGGSEKTVKQVEDEIVQLAGQLFSAYANDNDGAITILESENTIKINGISVIVSGYSRTIPNNTIIPCIPTNSSGNPDPATVGILCLNINTSEVINASISSRFRNLDKSVWFPFAIIRRSEYSNTVVGYVTNTTSYAPVVKIYTTTTRKNTKMLPCTS